MIEQRRLQLAGREIRTELVDRAVEMLNRFAEVSPDPDDLGKINDLTADEITAIIRRIEDTAPNMAGLIRDLQTRFPREEKFLVRGALMVMACAMAQVQPKELIFLGSCR